MNWSFSAHRTFIQCQRKWFFMQKVANSRAKKDPVRREAYLLKQLRSMPAWRGGIVDTTIEMAVVPALRRGELPSRSSVIDYARNLSRAQARFALDRRYREPGMTKTGAGTNYAAFFDVEYGGGSDLTASIQAVEEEVDIALNNLLSRVDFLRMLAGSDWLGAQRSLSFNLSADLSVRAHPDLVAFFNGAAPLIVDWKVSARRADDYWLQLAVYALALSSTNPHRDWPSAASIGDIDPTEVRLIEANLLTNQFKEHRVSEEDLDELRELILDSAWEMEIVGAPVDGRMAPEEVETAWNPRSCEYCNLRKICW